MKMKKNIPLNRVRVAPIRHEELTPEQERRIRTIHETFYEHDSRPLATAVEDFAGTCILTGRLPFGNRWPRRTEGT